MGRNVTFTLILLQHFLHTTAGEFKFQVDYYTPSGQSQPPPLPTGVSLFFFDPRLVEECRFAVDTAKEDGSHDRLSFLTPELCHVSRRQCQRSAQELRQRGRGGGGAKGQRDTDFLGYTGKENPTSSGLRSFETCQETVLSEKVWCGSHKHHSTLTQPIFFRTRWEFSTWSLLYFMWFRNLFFIFNVFQNFKFKCTSSFFYYLEANILTICASETCYNSPSWD